MDYMVHRKGMTMLIKMSNGQIMKFVSSDTNIDQALTERMKSEPSAFSGWKLFTTAAEADDLLKSMNSTDNSSDAMLLDNMRSKDMQEIVEFSMDMQKGVSSYLLLLKSSDASIHHVDPADPSVRSKYFPFDPEQYAGWKRFESRDDGMTYAARLASDGIYGNLSGSTGNPYSGASPEAQHRLTQMVINGSTPIKPNTLDNRSPSLNSLSMNTPTPIVNGFQTGKNKCVTHYGMNSVGALSLSEIKVEGTPVSSQSTLSTQATSFNLGSVKPPASSLTPVSTEAKAFDLGSLKLNFNDSGSSNKGTYGILYDISLGFPHKTKNANYHLVAMKKIGGNLWHFEASYLEYLFERTIPVFKQKGWEIPYYMNTFEDTPIRDSSGKYKRDKKSYTKNMIFFVFEVPQASFKPDVHFGHAQRTIHSFFKEGCDSPPGAVYVDWLAANKEHAYNYELGESNSKKKKITREQLVTQMNSKLINAFSSATPEWGQSLDKYLTDWHVRAFLKDHCGYENFNDVPENLKSNVYKRFPHVPMPEWDKIVREEY